VLKQARQLWITAQFIASVAILGAKNFQELAGEGAEGLYFSSSTPAFLNSKEPSVRKFIELYRTKYHEEPGVQHVFAARAYDAAILAAKALTKCGEESDCIRDYLFAVKNYSGASGSITFDRNGDVANTFSLQRVIHGQFTPVTGMN
jgi:branched-chain amino acid transport system substrate-binding protein